MRSKKEIWFKAKTYGYGWYPSMWQGWLILFIFILAEILTFAIIDKNSHSASDTLRPFIIFSIIYIVILISICIKKGEKAKWRWGKDKK